MSTNGTNGRVDNKVCTNKNAKYIAILGRLVCGNISLHILSSDILHSGVERLNYVQIIILKKTNMVCKF